MPLELAFSECENSQSVPDLLCAGPVDRVGGRWQQQIDVREEDVHELWDSVTTEAVCEVEETRHIKGQNDTDVGTTCPKGLSVGLPGRQPQHSVGNAPIRTCDIYPEYLYLTWPVKAPAHTGCWPVWGPPPAPPLPCVHSRHGVWSWPESAQIVPPAEGKAQQ